MAEHEDFSLELPTLSLQCRSEVGGERGGAVPDPTPKQLTVAAEEEEFSLDLPTCTLIENEEDTAADTDNASDFEDESVAEQQEEGESRAALNEDPKDVSDETPGPRDEAIVSHQHVDEVKLDQFTEESLDPASGNIWLPGEPKDGKVFVSQDKIEKLDLVALEVDATERTQQGEALRQGQRETPVQKRSRPDEQQQDHPDKLHLLASECKSLQDQLDNERQLTRKLHQEQREMRRSLEEEAEREKAWSLQVYKKYKRLKKASTETPGLMYDMETLRLQNKIIVTKFENMEERYKDMVLQKDAKISKHEATIDKLQGTVDKLKTRKLKMGMRQSQSNLDLKEDAKQDSSANARVQCGPLDDPQGTQIPGVDMNELASAIKKQEQRGPGEPNHVAFENERLYFEKKRLQRDLEEDADTTKLLSYETHQPESGNKRLQGQEASISSQPESMNVVHLTFEVQQLSSENNRLRGELWDVLHQQKDADQLQTPESQQQVAELKVVQQLSFDNNRLRAELEEALHESWCAREAAACQQRKDAEKLKQLTLENRQLLFEMKRLETEIGESKRDQQMSLENKGVQAELEDALHKRGHDREAESFSQHLVSDSKRLKGELEDGFCATQYSNESANSTTLAPENERLKGESEEQRESTFEMERLWSTNSRLQGELEDALCENRLVSGSQQQDKAVKLEQVTLENQQLVSENKRLKGEVEEALWERQMDQKQNQVDREARRRLQDEVKQERARFMRVYKKLERLRKSPGDVEEAKYEPDLEDRPRPHLHQEIMTQRDVIAKNQATIAKLQCRIDSLGAHQSESKVRQEQLEVALTQERTQRVAVEERARHSAAALEKERKRAAQIAAALKKEKAVSKKYNAVLQEAMSQQANEPEQQQQQHLVHCPPAGSDLQWT